MAQFVYEWTVRVETDYKISDEALAVIHDLKEEFGDGVDAVLDIEEEFSDHEDFVSSWPVEYHVASVPATLPEHSGSILKVVTPEDDE
jgi:hypothetical protein